MQWGILKTKKDYNKALTRLEELFDARKYSKHSDELELVSLLIDHYESRHFPVDPPDPVEAIKLRMEELGVKQKDLAAVLGLKSRVSEILNRKRKLTLDMIRKIHIALDIPLELLLKEY